MKLYCPECKETFEDVTLTSCPRDDARLFSLEEAADDALIGVVIDQRFRIEAKIGQGGMGAVYTATQLSVGRQVAVKVLKKELVDREVALERFYRESKLTSELSHPNIVKLIDFGQDRERDLLYLVMELVSGANMGDLLDRGRMRVPLALELIYQVCGALTEPHALGIVHRDLKPDNLLIVPVSDGTIQVKVLDFGIARALEANTQLTATGMVCGTPAYMAPEQAQNQEISPQTDLYALGVILYEMLCGVPPFDGQNSLQIMLQHIQIAPKPLSHYIPPSALPDEVEALVHDLLSKTPENRPKSAREVRTTIEQIRRLYNLEPVRIDPDAPFEHLFDDLILARMPGLSSNKSHTEALRRETNLERHLGASSYTTDERNQIGLAETSAHTPEFVTVPAHTALNRNLVHDAQLQTARPPQSEIATLPPSPRIYQPHPPDEPVRTSPRGKATHTHPASSPPKQSGGIKLIAGGILVSVLVAALALIAIIASQPGDTSDPVIAQDDASTPTPTIDPVVAPPAVATQPEKKEPSIPPPLDPPLKLEPATPLDEPSKNTEVASPKKDPPPKKEEVKKAEVKKTNPEKKAAVITPKADVKEPEESVPAVVVKKDPPFVKPPTEKEEKKVKEAPEKEEKKGLGNLFGGKKKSPDKNAADHFTKP